MGMLHQISSWFREIGIRVNHWAERESSEWSLYMDGESHDPQLPGCWFSGIHFPGRRWENPFLEKLKGSGHSDIWRNRSEKSISLPSHSSETINWQLFSSLHPLLFALHLCLNGEHPSILVCSLTLNMNRYPRITRNYSVKTSFIKQRLW